MTVRRFLILLAATIVVFSCLGYLSAFFSLDNCGQQTHDSLLLQIKKAPKVHPFSTFAESKQEVRIEGIRWLTRKEVTRNIVAPIKHYRPAVPVKAPYAFIVNEPSIIPFVVSSRYGYLLDPLAGAGGTFTYFTFFGYVHPLEARTDWLN